MHYSAGTCPIISSGYDLFWGQYGKALMAPTEVTRAD
jgi:hypothetical protein